MGLQVKCTLLSDFSENGNFWRDFRKIILYKKLCKSGRWKPRCSMRTGQHDEANIRFSQCYKELPKIGGRKQLKV